MKRASLLVVLLGWFAQNAAAELVMPPPANEYHAVLNKEHPWIFGSGAFNQANIGGFLTKEAELLAALTANRTFLAEAAVRPPLRNYLVRSYQKGSAQKYSLNKENAKKLAIELDDEDVQALQAQIIERLDAMEQQPLNSVLVGVLRSFPKDLGQQGFKIADVTEKVEFVLQSLNQITDEQIRQEFQGARYGLKGDTWGTKEVAQLVQRALQTSRELFEMSVQYLSSAKGKRSLLFEGRDELSEAIQELLDAQLGRKTNWRLINPEFALWMDQYFSVQQTEIPVVQFELELEELPPYAATFRGCITQDCSTSNSPFYPYSPFERNFLIKRKGEVLAHASGTIVRVNKRRVFYFHDLRGVKGDANTLNLVLMAVCENYKIFGVDGVVLLTEQKRGHIGWGTDHIDQVTNKSERVALEYYPEDHVIRGIIDKYVATAGYDNVASNTHAYTVLENYKRAGIGETEILVMERDGRLTAGSKQFRNALTIQRIAALLAGSHLPADVPAEEQKALVMVAESLQNPKRLKFAAYYELVEKALAEVQLKFSNKLFSDNPSLFQAGHFQCPDIFTEGDEIQDRRTYALVYNMLFHDLEGAAAALKGLGEEWLRKPKMQKLLAQFVGERGAQGLERLNKLIALKVPVIQILVENDQTRKALFASGNQPMINEAVAFMSSQGLVELDDDAWVNVANLLENEDKNVDEAWSLTAARLFARVDPPPNIEAVRTQLRASVKHEEDEEISLFASIAYLRYGIADLANATDSEARAYAKAAQTIEGFERPKGVPAALYHQMTAGIDAGLVARGVQLEADREAERKAKKRRRVDPNCAAGIVDQIVRGAQPRQGR